MKLCLATVGVALCGLVSGIDASAMKNKIAGAMTFGPSNCVSLSRSSAGSCVISTECEGDDISQTEFAFDCISQKHVVRHSFGVGGFEASEEFDTDVKCDRCRNASPIKQAAKPVALKSLPWAVTTKEADVKETHLVASEPAKVNEAKEPEAKVARKVPEVHQPKSSKRSSPIGIAPSQAEVQANNRPKPVNAFVWPWKSAAKPEVETVKYGPNGCVSTHQNKAGHCVMVTDCAGEDMHDYEYGLVCVDSVGSPVKHLFGKDSFDDGETFDTLIKCKECLGLEDIPDAVTLSGEVAIMAKEMKSLSAVLANISTNVEMLNAKVFPAAPQAAAPAPAAAVAAAPVAASNVNEKEAKKAVKEDEDKTKPKKKGLLAHRHEVKKYHLRRSASKHHRHHQSQEYDDDEESDDADEKDDDYESGEKDDRSSDDESEDGGEEQDGQDTDE